MWKAAIFLCTVQCTCAVTAGRWNLQGMSCNPLHRCLYTPIVQQNMLHFAALCERNCMPMLFPCCHCACFRRLYLAYTVFWAIGGLLAMQVSGDRVGPYLRTTQYNQLRVYHTKHPGSLATSQVWCIKRNTAACT